MTSRYSSLTRDRRNWYKVSRPFMWKSTFWDDGGSFSPLNCNIFPEDSFAKFYAIIPLLNKNNTRVTFWKSKLVIFLNSTKWQELCCKNQNDFQSNLCHWFSPPSFQYSLVRFCTFVDNVFKLFYWTNVTSSTQYLDTGETTIYQTPETHIFQAMPRENLPLK